MKKTILLILIGSFLFSCGEAPENKNNQNSDQLKSQTEEPTKTTVSADYSSLLTNYTCDMDIAEVAKVLEVPEGDLSIPDYAKEPNFAKTGMCFFSIKGFGKTTLGGETNISWGSEDGMSPSDVKREIESYLKNQKEMPASVQKITGMRIELA
ncbi:MAG: hypothetical protein KJN70_04570, partial [Eudoraea sp.]|nr:hypothetical protein [Eudoraea sp.]